MRFETENLTKADGRILKRVVKRLSKTLRELNKLSVDGKMFVGDVAAALTSEAAAFFAAETENCEA